MNSRKFTTILVVILMTVFTLAVCLLCLRTVSASAAEISATAAENEPEPPVDNDGEETLADRVKAYLQGIYGDDYEVYYNKIIENWGSVENFLLNASDNLPDEYKYKATELLTTVNAWVGVGADAILLFCVGIYILYRAKKNKKITADLATLKACDNQIEEAQLAIMKSQKAQAAALCELLPGTKYESTIATLKESDKALDAAAEEVKKIV